MTQLLTDEAFHDVGLAGAVPDERRARRRRDVDPPRRLESPAFAEAKESDTIVKMPIVEVLTRNWRTVLLAGGTFIATNGIAYVFMVYVLKYGTKPNSATAAATMLALLIVSCPVWMAGMAVSAWKSDVARPPPRVHVEFDRARDRGRRVLPAHRHGRRSPSCCSR